jgi:hypothetical protein
MGHAGVSMKGAAMPLLSRKERERGGRRAVEHTRGRVKKKGD